VIPVWFAVTDFNTKKDPHSDPNHPRWLDGYNSETKQFHDPSRIWELACAEYCGTRHSMMRGRLFVHENEEDFKDWLKWGEGEQDRDEAPGVTEGQGGKVTKG